MPLQLVAGATSFPLPTLASFARVQPSSLPAPLASPSPALASFARVQPSSLPAPPTSPSPTLASFAPVQPTPSKLQSSAPSMASLCILTLPLATLILALIIRIVLVVFYQRRNRKNSVGFFHPYTNDGGGGERVLWCAVKAVQEESSDLECVVYTGDHDASPESLTARAIDRFGVQLIRPPQVVNLYKRKWVEETTYPWFTMIGQSIGSVYLSWEALCTFTPLYYFDTSGYAFTYPVARMFGCKVICYTHYPTISLDMLSRVHARSSMYNNDALIAKRSSAGVSSAEGAQLGRSELSRRSSARQE